MNYFVNLESLHKNFPPDCDVPALLLEFGTWLESKRAECPGYFSLESQRVNDYWIENERFALTRFGQPGCRLGGEGARLVMLLKLKPKETQGDSPTLAPQEKITDAQ